MNNENVPILPVQTYFGDVQWIINRENDDDYDHSLCVEKILIKLDKYPN